MSKLKETEKILLNLLDKTPLKNKIFAIALFGSILNKNFFDDSDVDILIFGNLDNKEKFELFSELVKEFSNFKQKIDVHFSDEFYYINFPIKFVWFDKNKIEDILKVVDPFSKEEIIDRQIFKEYLTYKLNT